MTHSLGGHNLCASQAAWTFTTADIHRVESTLHELNDETKRDLDIVAESLRDDIRMIAEGVVALAVKVDSLGR